MTWRLTSIESVAVLVLGTVAGVFLIKKVLSMLKVCLFSPVKGIVVNKGQPVVGAVIERSYRWNWKDQKGGDQTVTDQNGEFSLPAIYAYLGHMRFVPHQPVIHQDLLIKHDGATYGAWHCTKMDYREFDELDIADALGEGPGLNGKPINLYCDLEAELKPRGGYGGIGVLR